MARSAKQHLEAVVHFRQALLTLLSMSEPRNDPFGRSQTIGPRGGVTGEWLAARSEVDRATPAASAAFLAAGVIVSWKRPGSWELRPLDPAQAWSTILDEYPMFGTDTLLACCDRAVGFFEAGLHPPERRPVVRTVNSTLKWVAGLAAAVLAAVIAAYIVWRLGWNR